MTRCAFRTWTQFQPTRGTRRVRSIALLSTTVIVAALFFSAISSVHASERSSGQTAWTSMLRGERADAIGICRELINEDRDVARAVVCLAESGFDSDTPQIVFEVLESYDGQIAAPILTDLATGRIATLERAYEKAIPSLTKALAAIPSVGSPKLRLVAHEALGAAHQDSGKPVEAMENLEAARALAISEEDPLARLSAEYGIAYVSIYLENNAEAKRLIDAMMPTLEERSLHRWVGHARLLRGILHWFDLELPDAEREMALAAEAYGRSHDPGREAGCLRRLAGLDGTEGRYSSAVTRLHRARALALSAGQIGEAAFCLEHLGSMSHELGDDDLALEQWARAIAEGGELWPREWLSAPLLQISSVLRDREQYDRAVEYLDRAMDALEETHGDRNKPTVLTLRAQCRRLTGNVEAAMADLESAIEISREVEQPLSEADAEIERSRCYVERLDFESANRSLDRAAALTADRGFLRIDLELAVERARTSWLQEDEEAARAHAESALEVVERLRVASRGSSEIQEGALGTTRDAYEIALEVHLESDRAEAFRILQTAKSRAFLDLLGELGADLRIHADPELVEREARVNERIGEVARTFGSDPNAIGELQLLEDELRILESEIRERTPRYATIQYPEPIPLDEVQSRLGPDEVLLEYFVGQERSYLCVVSRRTAVFHRLPAREVVLTQMEALLPLLEDPNLTGADPVYYLAPSRVLASTLLSPALGEMAEATRLLIVPDGPLHHLPFEALTYEPGAQRDPTADPASFRNVPFLVRSMDVEYLPSSILLGESRASDAESGSGSEPESESESTVTSVRSKQLLLVGGPEVTITPPELLRPIFGAGIEPTPHASFEIEAITASFPASHEELLGPEANLAALRARTRESSFHRVHFVAHGVLNERMPRYSGLVLSPSDGDDGFLSVADVFSLELDTEQVVLSACSSASSSARNGSGLLGLTRAFLYAGAHSVVASLWDVSGRATSEMMGELYRIDVADTGSKDPLGLVKRSMLEGKFSDAGEVPSNYAHPYYWSGFVRIGGGRR